MFRMRNELLRGSRRLDFMINKAKSHILRYFGWKSIFGQKSIDYFDQIGNRKL